MDIRELRIGNKIQAGSHVITVKHIWSYGEIYTPEEGVVALSHPQITAIPLTEQWLKKAGFEEVYDHTCRWHELGIGDLVFYQGDKNGYVEVVLDGFENVRVRYVHSLQNLFWCLTGEELKIA